MNLEDAMSQCVGGNRQHQRCRGVGSTRALRRAERSRMASTEARAPVGERIATSGFRILIHANYSLGKDVARLTSVAQSLGSHGIQFDCVK